MDVSTISGAASLADAGRTRGATDAVLAGFELDKADSESAAAGVTGGASSRLDTASATQAIQAGQEVEDESDSTLPIGLRHYMEDIAADPAYAAEQARGMAYSTPVVFCSIADSPQNGDPAEVWMAYSAKMDAKFKVANAVQDKIRALYEDESKQGIAPAQIYADMLTLQSSQSSEYLETRGPSGLEARQMMDDMHAALTKAMAKTATTADDTLSLV